MRGVGWMVGVSVTLACIGSLAAACGGDDTSGSGSPDATIDGTRVDATSPDVSSDATPDATPDATADTGADTAVPDAMQDASADSNVDAGCVAPAPYTGSLPDAAALLAQPVEAGIVGTPLVVSDGGTVSLVGVTSDDFVVYIDSADPNPRAAPLDGGAAQTPFASVDAGAVNVSVGGPIVFFAGPYPPGDSYVWRAGSAPFQGPSWPGFVMRSSVVATGAGGSRAVVWAQAFGTGNVVYGVDLTAQANALLVQASPMLPCILGPPGASFVGATALLEYCTNGSLPVEIAGYAGASWTKTTYVVADAGAGPPGFAVDPAGGVFLATDGNGNLALYSVTGGPAVSVSSNVTGFQFTPDGSAFLYATSNNGTRLLLRAATASPQSPMTIGCGFSPLPVTGCGSCVGAMSPDANFAAVTTGTDLWLASTTTQTWRPVAHSAAPVGFTADSAHFLFLDSATGLWSQPVSGGPPTRVAAGFGNGVAGVQTLSGGKIVFLDNSTLYAWDSSGTNVPTAVTDLPRGSYDAISSTKTVAVYQVGQPPTEIVTVPLP